MANVLGALFQEIADAIRTKTGGTNTLAPADFPGEILSITAAGGETLTTVLEEQTLSFDESGTVTKIKPNFLFAIGETYTVIWDGVKYEREAAGIEEEGSAFAIPYIGNPSLVDAGEEDNGDPFIIYLASLEAVSIVTSETGRSHTVSIYTDTNALLPVQFLFPFTLSEAYGAYMYTISPAPVIPVVGETYIVEWDGKSYTCVGQDMSGMAEGAVGLGNLASFGGDGNDEPFIIGYIFGGLSFLAFDAELSHTAGIYPQVSQTGTSCVVAASGTITKPSGLVTVEHGLGVTPDVIVVWVPAGGGNQPPETTRYTEFELGMSQAFLDKFSIDTGGVSYASDNTVADKVGGYDTTETRGVAWEMFGWIFVPKGNTEHFQVGTVSASASQTYYSGTNYTWLAIGGLT